MSIRVRGGVRGRYLIPEGYHCIVCNVFVPLAPLLFRRRSGREQLELRLCARHYRQHVALRQFGGTLRRFYQFSTPY